MNKKIIGIIIILLLLGSVVVMYINWNSKSSANNNQNSNTTVEDDIEEDDTKPPYNVEFKNFTFELPGKITYSKVDDNKIKFATRKYTAIIEPYIDADDYVVNNPDGYYEILLSRGIEVAKPEKRTIGSVDVYRYAKIKDKNNTALYYFKFYESKIVFELEISNNQDGLGEIINIILKSQLDPNTEYDYRNIDLTKGSQEVDTD